MWEAYGAARWAVNAIQQVGTFDTKKVAEALAESKYQDHPFGPATWGGAKTYGLKRQIVAPIPASILKDGKWEQLEVVSGAFD